MQDLETITLQFAAAVRAWMRHEGERTPTGLRTDVAMTRWHELQAARATLLVALAQQALEFWDGDVAMHLLRAADRAITANVEPRGQTVTTRPPWCGPVEQTLAVDLV